VISQTVVRSNIRFPSPVLSMTPSFFLHISHRRVLARSTCSLPGPFWDSDRNQLRQKRSIHSLLSEILFSSSSTVLQNDPHVQQGGEKASQGPCEKFLPSSFVWNGVPCLRFRLVFLDRVTVCEAPRVVAPIRRTFFYQEFYCELPPPLRISVPPPNDKLISSSPERASLDSGKVTFY